MEPMTDELKETIIREQPGGIWLVLAEENPSDIVTRDALWQASGNGHSVFTAHGYGNYVKPPLCCRASNGSWR